MNNINTASRVEDSYWAQHDTYVKVKPLCWLITGGLFVAMVLLIALMEVFAVP